MTLPSTEPASSSRAYRVTGAILGAVFVASGLYVALTAFEGLPLVGAALLLALGGNLLWSAWRGRASWLGRIGPLP